MTLSEDLTWLRTHVILLGLLAGMTFALTFGVLSVIDKHDSKIAAQYQVQNQQFQQQMQTEIAGLQAANVELAKQLSTRQTVEQNIPTQNGSLTASQIADAITKALQAKQGSVTVTSPETVCMDLPVAQNLTSMAQLVPLLKQDKIDLQKSLDNETKLYVDEVAAHKSDNEANAKEVKALKASARKGKLKWFGIGYVAGFLTRTILVP